MTYSKQDLLEMYYYMVLARQYEDKIAEESKKGKLLGMFHFGKNQEAVDAAIMTAIRPEDVIMAYHRNHGAVFKRLDIKRYTASLMAKRGGYNNGLGGDIKTFSIKNHNIYPRMGVLGTHFCATAGFAYTMKLKKTGGVMLSVCGEGTTAQGSMYEGMNLASLLKLPIIYIVENNSYGMTTPIENVTVTKNLADHAKPYNFHTYSIDGQDPVYVRQTVEEALTIARGCEPCFIEVRTYRLSGHYFGDPKTYVDKEREKAFMELYPDPIPMFEQRWEGEGVVAQEDFAAQRQKAREVIDDAFEWAYNQPDVTAEDILGGDKIYSNTERGLLL